MDRRGAKSAFAAGLLAACMATTALTPAWAQDASQPAQSTQDFAIPAQPLQAALLEFSRQANVSVVASANLTAGRQARAVQGRLTTGEALAQLVDGTGLRPVRNAAGGWAVAAAPGADSPQGGSAGGGAETNVVQELVVTAQKKSENIQVVPIAISAFTQKDLTTRQVTGGPDLMTQVPNMTFTKTNFSGYSIEIRGIGTQAISATTDPAVAVAFNNTPFIRNRFFEQEFYDLERLEVLRGPQGTLYGRNATAGVVNLISAKPNFSEFQAKAAGDIANYNSKRLEGMINLPLVDDKVGLRLAGAWTKRDGFVKNILTGEQTDGRDLWSARATLGIEPNDRFKAYLIYEHFSENDDRLRSGKQLCNKDPGPSEIDGVPIDQTAQPLDTHSAALFSQGCKPASLYSPDSFQTPNGYSLPYYGAAGAIGSPVYIDLDPYLHSTQSRNLREIETNLKPDYEATNDTVELQLQYQLSENLSLSSETGFNHDYIFSFEDYNRFDTTPGVFVPGGPGQAVDQNGVFCDPQLGCTNRLAAGDLSTAKSRQFSQEFRLSSSFDGPLNFSAGANFLRYDTEEKYYVFVNSLTALLAGYSNPWIPGVSDGSTRLETDPNNVGDDRSGFVWSNPNKAYGLSSTYIDPNNIHNLNDEGRNYFLSLNPYHLISYAAFGEAYYNITPTLKLTGGFRWTIDKKTAPQIPSWLLAGQSFGLPARKVIKQEWDEPTGRFAIDWRPKLSFTDETLLYASYVRGYKAGGANPPPPIVVGAPVNIDFDGLARASLTHPETFAPEFVNAFEVGTKNTLMDGRLSFNLNAFYYDYTGYQISEIVDRSAVNLNFDAKIWGSELEIDWRPLQNLRLGFKGGYENTRLAKGSQAVDLMDRTAGQPGWVVKRPFPTIPSNCIVPVESAFSSVCEAYILGTADWTAPNNGEGFAKDLSGNELPNAPHFTATLTTDYTLPLGEDWLATLHGDFYMQSEAWTRVFNTPGYDRLKAYNNINLAGIFSNEKMGLQVMLYAKNLLDRDSITGAFLNSDDTGLTTNVFLTDPRLYGIKVTKQFNGTGAVGGWWAAHEGKPGAYNPFRLELEGEYGHVSDGHELFDPPTVALFPAAHPYPLGIQHDIDWGTEGGGTFAWQPEPQGWFVSAGVRYGHAGAKTDGHTKWSLTGGYLTHKYHHGTGNLYIDPTARGMYNYATTTASNEESHAIVDFDVGKDVGLGGWDRLTSSRLSAGLRFAHLGSTSDVVMHGRPDLAFPADDIWLTGGHMHRFHLNATANREFEGTGLAAAWDGSIRLAGDAAAAGRLNLDLGAGGALLWGRQKTRIGGEVHGNYEIGRYSNTYLGGPGLQYPSQYSTPLTQSRSKSVTVPAAQANLGLSYDLGRITVKGGYRRDRYFNAIDGGIATRKTYDRQFDGPYFKVSVGFGG